VADLGYPQKAALGLDIEMPNVDNWEGKGSEIFCELLIRIALM
jgi:hypothetical protein